MQARLTTQFMVSYYGNTMTPTACGLGANREQAHAQSVPELLCVSMEVCIGCSAERNDRMMERTTFILQYSLKSAKKIDSFWPKGKDLVTLNRKNQMSFSGNNIGEQCKNK